MGRPYSNDLRERVVAAVESGGMSRHQAAAHFGVGISTAINWVRRARETGSVAPGKMGGHKRKSIAGAHRDWLRARVQEGSFSLRELVAELAARGLEVDYRTVWEFVRAERLSFDPRLGWRPRVARPRDTAEPEPQQDRRNSADPT